jgi:hypothetical protein
VLFPNHPAYAEIRSGMGDTSHLGYSSGAFHLGYASGARGLGSISASMKNLAVDDGIDTSDIDLLDSLGAIDQDITDLVYGNVTLTSLYAKYGVAISTPATGAGSPGGTVAAAPALESPKGSTLLFNANWTAGVGNLSVSPDSAIASLTSALAAHNMSVVSAQATSSGPINYGIQVLIQDNIGHDTIANATSIPTGIMRGIVGNNLSTTPTLTMVTPGGSSGTAAPGAIPATDALAWLENNALYIALGVGGLVLLNNFTRGKRR